MAADIIRVHHIKSEFNRADILTKPLGFVLYNLVDKILSVKLDQVQPNGTTFDPNLSVF